LTLSYINNRGVISCEQDLVSAPVNDETGALEQLQQLKRKNKELYEIAVSKIMKS